MLLDVPSATPHFWRDAHLPFIEARSIADGRKVSYAPHSHTIFSIGAITSGRCEYMHEKTRREIGVETVVVMNPGDVHACNPVDDQPWSYVMLYVDAQWLAGIQHASESIENQVFEPVAATYTLSAEVFKGLVDFYATLVDPCVAVLAKHEAAIGFFTLMQQKIGRPSVPLKMTSPKVERVAQYIDAHYLSNIRLQDMCDAANLSEAYLIRAFELRYHMTPHAYVLNRRIQHAQRQLRKGASIADTAQQAGFSDQAHFQRVFKKHFAATPGQYKA